MKYVTESLADALYKARVARNNLINESEEVKTIAQPDEPTEVDDKELAKISEGEVEIEDDDTAEDATKSADEEEVDNALGLNEETESYTIKDISRLDDKDINELVKYLKKIDYDDVYGYPSSVSFLKNNKIKYEYSKIGPDEWCKVDNRTDKVLKKGISSKNLVDLLRTENQGVSIRVDNVFAADEVDEARWVTMHGNHALVDDEGGILKGGDPKKRVKADKKTIDAAVKDANSKSKSEKKSEKEDKKLPYHVTNRANEKYKVFDKDGNFNYDRFSDMADDIDGRSPNSEERAVLRAAYDSGKLSKEDSEWVRGLNIK